MWQTASPQTPRGRTVLHHHLHPLARRTPVAHQLLPLSPSHNETPFRGIRLIALQRLQQAGGLERAIDVHVAQLQHHALLVPDVVTRVERAPVPEQLQQVRVEPPVPAIVPAVHALQHRAQVHRLRDDLAVCGELLRVKSEGRPYRCIHGVLEDEGAGLVLEVFANAAQKGLYLWG